MPQKRRTVPLTKTERVLLETFGGQGKKSARALTRARLLLLSHEGRKDREIRELLGVSRGTVHNVRTTDRQKGRTSVLELLQDAHPAAGGQSSARAVWQPM